MFTVQTYDKTNDTTIAKANASQGLESVQNALLSPLKAVSGSESKLISEKDAGVQALLFGAAAFVAGEWIGHKRAAGGAKPFIPVAV